MMLYRHQKSANFQFIRDNPQIDFSFIVENYEREQILFQYQLNKNNKIMSNNQEPPTPIGMPSLNFRVHSVCSPFLSPLRITQSPFCYRSIFMNSHQANVEFNNFQLEDYNHENQYENIDQAKQEESSFQPPKPEHEFADDIILDESNILEFILSNINRNPLKIEFVRNNLEQSGSEINKRLFDYLEEKFQKLRKTKEEMVKYCVRKSFKHITNKMRAANKAFYATYENNEVVAQYFEKNCEGDLSISIPFKKQSVEKTMNANFLSKIFKCRQYNLDYKQFLKNFPADYSTDNRKKIKSMNEVIKKCVKNKCFKKLDEYKRLPWTFQILERTFEFAKKLMVEYSPYKRQCLEEKRKENEENEEEIRENEISFARQKSEDAFQIIRNAARTKVALYMQPNLQRMHEPEEYFQ